MMECRQKSTDDAIADVVTARNQTRHHTVGVLLKYIAGERGLFANYQIQQVRSTRVFVYKPLRVLQKIFFPPDWGMLRRSRCIQIFL